VLAALVEEADQLDEQFEIDDRPVALRISRV
jgi:hypothetical protein